MPPPQLPKTLSRDEVRALLAAPNLDCPTGLRDRCILEVLYRCGLRVSEACGLHLRDVHWGENKIHVRPEVGKSEVERYVYFGPDTGALLERWKAERRRFAAGAPWLFITLRGTQVDRRDVWKMMRRRAAKAGIREEVHPHMLRHTYATELLREGFSIVEVQRLLRHSDVRTTTIYLHLHDAELAAKVRARA